jgi:hypothetical protein
METMSVVVRRRDPSRTGKRNGALHFIKLAFEFYHRVYYTSSFQNYQRWLLLFTHEILHHLRHIRIFRISRDHPPPGK